MASGNEIRVGGVVGTGSAIDVRVVDFKPSKVELFNVDGDCKAVWLKSMPDAAMQKTVTSGAGTTDVSYVTSDGITPLSNGFRIGADTDLNASGETIHYVAHQ